MFDDDIYTNSIQFNLLVPKRKKTRTNKIRNPQPDRRTVNLPAGEFYIKLIEGEEHLCFMYNTKRNKSRTNFLESKSGKQEFCVKFHIENVELKNLSQKFKMENCVYPRVNLPQENYCGKRWEYETACNEMAYKFVLLNTKLLYGNKGLIQRSVDTYRNMNKLSRSRRAIKEEIINPSKRMSGDFPTVTVAWSYRGLNKSCQLRVDVENVDYDEVDYRFKKKYSVFTPFWDVGDFGKINQFPYSPDNELAVRIAYINLDNTSFWSAVKSADKVTILKSAVLKYKLNELDEPELLDTDTMDEFFIDGGQEGEEVEKWEDSKRNAVDKIDGKHVNVKLPEEKENEQKFIK
ncbi:hypothetical protein CDIK_0035 [Cucumispora dikerogammari]|nr:hypothetical protein CDIK_0035 [Cucumispora dikerogammari]